MVNPILIPVIRSGASTIKKYAPKFRNDTINKKIKTLEEEVEKWSSAISCIGREPYIIGANKQYCSIEKGGAINALGEKELFKLPYSRHPYYGYGIEYEYHRDPKKTKPTDHEPESLVEPSPEEAISLIERAINSLGETEGISYIKNLKRRRYDLTRKLVYLRKKIKVPYELGVDYSPIQEKLSNAVRQMVDIELDYKSEISKLKYQRFKKRTKVAAAATVTFTAGIVLGSKIKSLSAARKLI